MSRYSSVLGALIIYIVALLFQGYGYGIDDQIEIIPVIKHWLSGGVAYSEDFYVNAYLSKGLTERTPFLYLLYYLTGNNPWGFFALHTIVSVLLFMGIIKVAEKLTSSRAMGVFTGIILVSAGSYTSLGGNEIYYHYLIPSLPAKCLGVWALYLWLDRQPLASVILLAVATYIQPLVGLQLFGVLTLSGLWIHRDFIQSALSILIYAVFAGPWVILLLMQHGGAIDPDQYLEILEFRVGHHFFPGYLDLSGLVMSLALLSMLLLMKGRPWRPVKYIVSIIAVIGVFYALIAEFYPVPLVMNTQWFKTTIWIELLGVIAILAMIRDTLQFDPDRMTYYGSATMIIGLVFLQAFDLKTPHYGLPFNQATTAEAKVAEWAKDNTHQDAVFTIPPEFNAFKILSERSSYVEFKAMIHHPDYMKEYYRRIEETYGIDIVDRRQLGLSGMLDKAEENMMNKAEDLSGQADYLIVATTHVYGRSSLHPIDSIDGYIIYDLR